MKEKAEDLVDGRWPELLMSRGMSPDFFSGKSGPCPFCAGNDRYRWVQKKFGGVWVCNGCTNDKYATGFTMLMQHMGYKTFKEAADDVREYFLGKDGTQPIPRNALPVQRDEWTPERVAHNRARMLKLWNEAVELAPGDTVTRYIENRVPGTNWGMSNVRFHRSLAYWARPVAGGDGRPVKLGEYPAMLACAHSPNGELVQLHKTYLTPDGHKANVPIPKKTELGVGCNSFAVRLHEPTGDTLGVCEGMETGWAASLVRGIPVWPCLNGPALSQFVLPEYLKAQIKKLVIFADTDELKERKRDGKVVFQRPGSEYAAKCAELARAQGLRSLIVRPPKVGTDFADLHRELTHA